MIQARRVTGYRNVALLLLVSLAVLGLQLPAAGRALAAAQRGTSFTDGGPACALEAGQAYCWGSNANGDLGDGSTASSNVPVAVDTRGVLAGKTLTQISASDGYACALDTSGAAYCWGSNEHGQLGFGVLGYSDVPVRVSTSGVLAGKKLVQITAGQLEACALDSAGHAYCWGYNSAGELGNGSTVSSDVPVAVHTSGALAGQAFSQISAGTDYACALTTAGTAFCWGADQWGQLGDASGTASDIPVAVDASGVLAGKKLVRVSANESGYSTCAVAAGGSAYCWGFNLFGQLGDGSTTSSPVLPVAVDTSGVLAGKSLTQISAGYDETCAVDSAGHAYCWGQNYYGQLGDGGTVNSTVPVAVDTSGALAGQTLTQISADGFFSACAMSIPGAVYCWGDGQGSVPVAAGPSLPAGVTAVSGTRAAKVSWKVPVMHAGVTGYTAIAYPGEEICLTSTTSCTIKGLTNDITYSVAVVARTATANSASSASVSVTPGSRVAFTSNPYATAAFGAGFRFTVRATGGSPAPVISVRGTLPPGVTFKSQADGTAVLAGTPDRGAVGLYPLTFTAKSKAGVATQAFTLAITRAPVLAKLPSTVTWKMGENVSLPVKATGYPAPELLPSGTLPGDVFLDDRGNGTGVISGYVNRSTAGKYRFTVTAASTSGNTARTITVLVVQAPVITSPSSASVAIGYTLNFHVTATGFPAPVISESGRLPAGVTFHSATATLSGIPRTGTRGSYPITFTATNAAGKVKQAFTLKVT
jgi:alpha-tubulin suppressor-like RCC1 family protein